MSSHRATPTRHSARTPWSGRFLIMASVNLVSFLALVLAPPDLAAQCTDSPTTLPQSSWAEAFAVVTRLADTGSTAASRLALEMHRHGPTIYGTSFAASEQQLLRWQRQLACEAPPCFGQG